MERPAYGNCSGETEASFRLNVSTNMSRNKRKRDDTMGSRYVSIWFRYLSTDWFTLRQPQLKTLPFVLRTSSHGRMIITAVNAMAKSKGIQTGMALADARALHPELEVQDDKPDLIDRLLHRLA